MGKATKANIAEPLRSLVTPISDLHTMPGNPRKGDVEAVKRSYERFGQRKPIVALLDGTVIAGNHQLLAARALGWSEIAVVRVDDDEMTAKAFALADNRTADLGTYDDAALADLLAEVATDSELLLATGYRESDLDVLIGNAALDDSLTRDEIDNGTAAHDGQLKHNIDVFYNASPVLGKISTAMGFAAGIISRSVSASYLDQIRVLNLDINFVDNEFKEYDHEKHLAAVKILAPRYATVRDLMTKQQCAAAEIEYFTFDDIMDMAHEIARYAENVIVIPKYDCIESIPEHFMLGYSIPTAYGATPISLDLFRGRRVHLLGGNWKRQRNALGALGKDVVSLDNNHMMNIARFGQSYTPTGDTVAISQAMPGRFGNVVPLLLSMSGIIADLTRAGVTVNGRSFASKETRASLNQCDIIEFDLGMEMQMTRQEGAIDDE